MKRLFDWLLLPFKFHWVLKYFRGSPFVLLDVGCGNHSPSKTKTRFPRCTYYGIDRENYNNNESDMRAMERYFQIDLGTPELLAAVPDGIFDVIICSHVIEHVRRGRDLVKLLVPKLRAGGIIFIEYPSSRSLGLPSMRGTLRFSDDSTHCRLYSLVDLCNVLMDEGLRIEKAGVRRYWRRILLMPVVAIKNLHAPAGAFWDLFGFSEYIVARRGEAAGLADAT